MILDASMWIWIPLSLAIIFAFLHQIKTSITLITICLVGSLIENRLNIIGLVTLIVGLAIAYRVPNLEHKWKIVSYIFIILWSVALFIHLIPGFNNAKVLDAVISGPQSTPFTMYLNLDKPFIFFGLLLASPSLLGSKVTFNKKAILMSIILLFSLLPIAWGVGVLQPETKIPNWWWLFLLNNLLLTCVAEEAFFRGFVQQSLSKKFGWVMGVTTASLLFGFAHFYGGILIVAFATLAGVCYGLIYHFSSRLWVAVIFHFLFNFVHLLFFTYPMMK